AHRQFHQRRAVGPRYRRALGHGLPDRRPLSAPSEPDLRGVPRRHRSLLHPQRAGALHPYPRQAGRALRRLPHRLRHRADHRRVLPRAGQLPRLHRLRLAHDGADPVAAADRRRPRPAAPAAAARKAGVNALGELLARRIRAQGPLTVADFMAEALGHPEHGYYATRDPLGRRGDFTTASEISQIFGELIGLWCADLWDRMGRPSPFILAELGPGRGTLMADALRAARVMPGFLDAMRLHLVETSPVLRRAQTRALAPLGPQWHDSIASLPEGPLLAVANEFLDALPIRQLVKTTTGWREKLVGLSAESDGLAFALAPGPSLAAALVPRALAVAPEGSQCEVSPAAVAVADAMAR